MNRFIIIVLLALCSDLQGQWLNEIYKVTASKANAKFYRQRIPTESGGYIDKIYYLNDSLYSVSELSSIDPEVRNGKYTEYHKNGRICLNCEYLNGLKNGKSYTYHENGKLSYEEDYQNGELHGYVKGYYESGVPRRVDRYDNGQFAEGKCFGKNGQDTTYFVQSIMARFKNGDLEKYRNYVQKELVYPRQAIEGGIKGTVYVSFCVNSKGKVVDVRVIESPSHYLSKAVTDVVIDSPDWTPAMQEGRNVKQQFAMPVIFQLQ
jgi:TonB family protein